MTIEPPSFPLLDESDPALAYVIQQFGVPVVTFAVSYWHLL
jgi:hypothetical protein